MARLTALLLDQPIPDEWGMKSRAPGGSLIESIVSKTVLLVAKPADMLPEKVGRVVVTDPTTRGASRRTNNLRVDDGSGDLQSASNWHSLGRAWKHPTVVIDWYGDLERRFTQGGEEMMICNVPNTHREGYISAPSIQLLNEEMSEGDMTFTELSSAFVEKLRGTPSSPKAGGHGKDQPPSPSDDNLNNVAPSDTTATAHVSKLNAIKSQLLDEHMGGIAEKVQQAASHIADIDNLAANPLEYMEGMSTTMPKLFAICKELMTVQAIGDDTADTLMAKAVSLEATITKKKADLVELEASLKVSESDLRTTRQKLARSRVQQIAKQAVDTIQHAVTPGKRKADSLRCD